MGKAANLSWKEAIRTVLADADGPMRYADIADEIVQRGLKKVVGATPARRVMSTLSSEIRMKGEDAIFERAGLGQYRLRSEAPTARNTHEPGDATPEEAGGVASSLSWKEAIHTVLADADGAMRYTDIADAIVERGLRKKVGATPASRVSRTLRAEIKSKGENALFERVARGQYRLRGRPEGGLSAKAAKAKDAEKPEEAPPEEAGGVISAFGMFWRLDYVNWRSNARLLGQQQRGAEVVDFAQQRGAYLLQDNREVIYAGRTTDQALAKRLFQHTYDRLNGRWNRFSWFGVLTVTEAGKLEKNPRSFSAEDWIVAMEALLIEALEPPQNRKRGDDFSAVEYLQVKDPELESIQKQAVLQELMKLL